MACSWVSWDMKGLHVFWEGGGDGAWEKGPQENPGPQKETLRAWEVDRPAISDHSVCAAGHS